MSIRLCSPGRLCFGGSLVAIALHACAPDQSSGAGPGSFTGPTELIAVAAHIAAPIPISPGSGAHVPDTQPTLTVENAAVTDGSTVTYTFELASDITFADVVASDREIPENLSGQTFWVVPFPLLEQIYYWRARAGSQRGIQGPYSHPVSFEISDAGVLVFDTLMDGLSHGDVRGGRFIAQGWEVTSKSDFLRYAVRTISKGFVEWENTGLQTTNPAPDNVMLFGMWDRSPEAGPYRTNAFRVHLRKLDDTLEPPFLRLRWIANGEQHDTGANVQFWDPGRVYRWRVEWGPSGLGNTVQVFLDGAPILLQQYTRDYAPKQHWIEFGVEERRESIVGAVYSNVRIGSR